MKMLWSVAFDVYLEQSCVLHFLILKDLLPVYIIMLDIIIGILLSMERYI